MLLGGRHMPRAFGVVPLFIALAMRPFPWAGAFTGRIAAASSRASSSGSGSGDCSARGSAVCKKPTCSTSRGQTLAGEETVVLAWKRHRPRRFWARWAGCLLLLDTAAPLVLFSKKREKQVEHDMPSGGPNDQTPRVRARTRTRTTPHVPTTVVFTIC